jgi:hypothetical protein
MGMSKLPVSCEPPKKLKELPTSSPETNNANSEMTSDLDHTVFKRSPSCEQKRILHDVYLLRSFAVDSKRAVEEGPPHTSLGSVMTPAIAEAATVAGEAK